MDKDQWKLNPISINNFKFNDCFWAPRIGTNREITIPHIYRMLEETGRIGAFDLKFDRQVPSSIFEIFGDSDTAKWIEAASLSLATYPDPSLDHILDQIIDKIIKAQQPDGYINTHFIRIQPEMRWKNLRDWHELYCAGHLIEAAVANYEATGKRSLVDSVCRYANHIDNEFGKELGKKPGYGGHPEIELALIKLYHTMKNPRYLELATYFLEARGEKPHYFDIEAVERGEDPSKFWAKTYEYCQAHKPIREQEKVVGHAVRAMYLFSAVADSARENDDPSLLKTCERLWQNLVMQRMYLTGGIGSSRHNEGFTQDYDLPNETAYAETCATIGLMLWSHRLLQYEGNGRYADVIEQALYNGFLSGVSLNGEKFFYENPLSSSGHHRRQRWFECPCCPPNVARFLPNLGSFFYSTSTNAIWMHLYAAGKLKVVINQREVQINIITRYPWDGKVVIRLELNQSQSFTLHLRVPGWCNSWNLKHNGIPLKNRFVKKGYLGITKEWNNGDELEFTMEMPIQVIWANPRVHSLLGRIALQRGPIVYCIEGVDHNQVSLDLISIRPELIASQFSPNHYENLLGGVTVLHGIGSLIDDNGWDDILYQGKKPFTKEIELKAVPYCTWENRDPGEMRVWLRSQ